MFRRHEGAPNPAVSLRVSDISLYFGGLAVLKGISFDVRAGQVLGLIGPNGAGKSALLNCITGLYHHTDTGRVYVHGRRIDRLAAYRRAATGLSRTFQHANLVPGRTVAENIQLGEASCAAPSLLREWLLPIRARCRQRASRTRVEAIAKRCGLAELLDERIDDLPLGIRRRVDLARALVSRPSVLLLDEPASGMSRSERELIPELIGIARQEGDLAVIWIEHDLDLVLAAATKVVVLHHGRKIHTAENLREAGARERVLHAYMNGA